jgi:hypothetical protein
MRPGWRVGRLGHLGTRSRNTSPFSLSSSPPVRCERHFVTGRGQKVAEGRREESLGLLIKKKILEEEVR